MSTVGVILSTVGDTQYRGDIMMHVGDIMSMVVSVQYHGGECFVIRVLHGTEHPHSTHDIPHMYHDIPMVLKFQRMVSPHSTEHPHGTHDTPHAS